jgi:hypothetical protein
MSRIAKLLVAASVATVVAAAPASASPIKHVAPTDSLVLKTCGGPNEIVQCRILPD